MACNAYTCRHPQASERPTFGMILNFLSDSETKLLQINAARGTNPDALKLGASIYAAAELHKDLQKMYNKV